MKPFAAPSLLDRGRLARRGGQVVLNLWIIFPQQCGRDARGPKEILSMARVWCDTAQRSL